MQTLDDLRQEFFNLAEQTLSLIEKLKSFSFENNVKNEPEEKLQKAQDVLGSIHSQIEFAGSFLDED